MNEILPKLPYEELLSSGDCPSDAYPLEWIQIILETELGISKVSFQKCYNSDDVDMILPDQERVFKLKFVKNLPINYVRSAEIPVYSISFSLKKTLKYIKSKGNNG